MTPIPPDCATGGGGTPPAYTLAIRTNGGRRIEGPDTATFTSSAGNYIEAYEITVTDGIASLVGATTATAVHISGAGYSAVAGEEFLMAAGQSHGFSANGRDNEWLDTFTVTVPAGQVAVVATLVE